ncbi:uncharacterized protein AC631_05287 [Debaryomyces fabryi]|uniref:Acetyltransferase n=1 Tax=Debaryomyces fabryi TaxID=58627 RepID=A0A0V1PRS8_9ASCO|nr:uncharacterized protein AC631_05287 [Debaryomyces fabryi]KRZ98947.1 hypothetical protein AC631_05287 [Debaryomyces fabryi]CUM56785.1 unnamed protein product [Debaryomyces fabryi]
MTIDALFNRADISASIMKKSLEGNKEYERMLAGKPYNSFDKDLILARTISSEIAGAYADIKLSDHGYDIEKHQKSRADYLSKYLFFKRVPDIYLEPPFFVDFGCNIKFGHNFYANFNATFLDCATITFGDNVLLGPNVTFTTAGHATDPQERLDGVEFAYPINIGSNVWFGANSIILPGITIGDGVVVGAGSVVTKSVSSDCVVVGSPARVIKNLKLTEEREIAIKETEK